jgi:DNA mismatch repair protein MutL
MGTIIKLDQDLINKIAAGEVVERPASVVKELIENSIDAKSDQIKIELKNSGKRKILIKDNGIGMSKEDALLSLERHTTSKIKDVDDLFRIKSLGFRGEALASIASVSDFSLLTNKQDLEIGHKIIAINNEIREEEIASPKGTTIIVKNLFENTPARKKYLSSDATELKHIIDIVSRYALAYPEISFTLTHNQLEILNAPAGNLKDKIVSIYGNEIAENLIEVNHKGVLTIKGYIGTPKISKKTRDFQSFFINKRFIKSEIITQGLEEAYKTLMFLDRKPFAVLDFEINPNKVDVNVHPSKLTVKFDNKDFIYGEVFNVIKDTLKSNTKLEPKVKDSQVVLFDVVRKTQADKKTFSIKKDTQELIEEKPIKEEYRILGQIRNTYIIIESQDGLLIIDQHAAAERINLEKINKMLQVKDRSQKLLQPIILKPLKQDVALINEVLHLLENYGFDIEPFGQDDFIIREVPIMFRKDFDKISINDFFEELVSNIKKSKKEQIDEEIIYSMACKGSVKANEELSIKQLYDLVDELFKTDQPYSCAHGRPTALKFTQHELEKMFKRS